MRAAWRKAWHQKADRLRVGWAAFEQSWEADTEPGYPLPPMHRACRDLGLAFADLYDAIGGARRAGE